MNEGYAIINGQVTEVKITHRYHDSGLASVIYTRGGFLRHTELPIETVYPDRETPEKILRNRKQYETPIIEEV